MKNEVRTFQRQPLIQAIYEKIETRKYLILVRRILLIMFDTSLQESLVKKF